MKKGKLYISILLGLCLCLFTAFGVACKEENSTGNSSTGGDSSIEEPATPTLESISVSGETEVFIDEFDYADYTITATYSDDSTKTATLTADSLSADDNAKLSTVGTHALTVNYESVTCSWTVTLKNHDFAGLTFDDVTTTYDGMAKTLAVSGFPTGAQVSYDKETSYTNAGEYTVKATVTLTNYNPVELTATLTIEKREIVVAFSGATTLKYNGNVQKTVTAQATNLVGNDSVEITISYNGEMIEAGEYIATATLTAHQNYKLTANNTVKVTITRATHTVTFKQDGVADIVKEVLDLADLTDIPTPQHVDGYEIKWDRKDFTSITEDITITAQKTLLTYEIEYVLNGGTDNGNNPTQYTVESATFTLKAPTASETFGTTFGGWFTSPDFSLDSKITNIEKGSFGDLKLYAYWLEYRVTEVVGGAVDYSQATPEITIKVDYGTANLAVKDLISVSDGCTWKLYTGFECLPTQELTAKRLSVSNIGDNIFYILVYHPDSNEYYTDYVLNVYQLDMKTYTFVKDGETWANGEIQEESALNAPEKPEKDGYTFDGWKVNGEFVSFPYTVLTDTEFVADYTLITYNVSYELNGGENDESNPKTYNIEQAYTLKNPIRTGYDFKGWFTEETFDNQVTEIALGSYGDKKFYAKWDIVTYIISYELNGGVNNTENPETYTIETPTITLGNPTRVGYTFAGWFTGETFDSQATEIALGSHVDKKFYAKWTANLNTIKFDGNGAVSGAMSSIQARTGETIKLPLNVFMNTTDYTYAGWAITASGSVRYADGATYTVGTASEQILYAYWKQQTASGLVWALSSESISITNYVGDSKSVTIPKTIAGYSVTSIGDSAFYGCSSLTSVTIGDGVTSIGRMAFLYCDCLTSIEVSENNTVYKSINGNLYNKNGTTLIQYAIGKTATSFTIFESVTRIGEQAFEGCSSLTSVVIGDSVTSIGIAAFYDCCDLTNVVIGEGVTSIGYKAFAKCINLTSVKIPNSVTSIGSSAFYGCSSLTEITLPFVGANRSATSASRSTLFGYIFGESFYTNGRELAQYYSYNTYANYYIPISLKKVTVTGGEILYGAFYNCHDLTNVVIGEGVTSIGIAAFDGCSSLTSVTIGNSVTSIGGSAFRGCINLTSVKIPNSVTSIDSAAFYNCYDLTNLVIPDSVTSIGINAFYGCSSLTRVVIGDGVTSISDSTFYGCSRLTSVVIGEGVTLIDWHAFYGCSRLTSVYYKGTASDWTNIWIYYNDTLKNTRRYYYSETEPALNSDGTAYDGNYWHYGEDGKIVVWVYNKK